MAPHAAASSSARSMASAPPSPPLWDSPRWPTSCCLPRPARKRNGSKRATSPSWRPTPPVEMAFRRNRVDGWKVVSEKSHGLGGRRPARGDAAIDRRLRPAMHAPGLRLPLGRRQERIRLPLPQLGVLHRWQGGLRTRRRARWTGMRPKSTAASCCSGDLRQARKPTGDEAPIGRHRRLAGPPHRHAIPPSAIFSTKRSPPPAAGTRSSAAWPCSCSWCRPSPACCWPSTTRPRPATPTTACATSSPK